MWVDRPLARFGSWYEMFPRSTGGWDAKGKPVHGTFATAAAALPRIAQMGFDVVYLPPIHPIGKVHRKGRNNTATAAPGDVGSPWAIGSDEGGHDAVHPQLGTIADFDKFVAAAEDLGLGGGARSGAAMRAGSPVGQGPPPVVHRIAGRHHRLRREPAEEVPGHLPDQLRQRPRRSLRRSAPCGPVLDGSRRQDLSRRQPAHQATKLLGVVDRSGKAADPDVLFLSEAFTPAGSPIRFGQAGIHPVLHLLHLAHLEVGAHRIRRADPRNRATTGGPTSSSTPPTSCTRACSTTGRACSRYERCWRRP